MKAAAALILVCLSSLTFVTGNEEFKKTFDEFFGILCGEEPKSEDKMACVNEFPEEARKMAAEETGCEDNECMVSKMCDSEDVRNEIITKVKDNAEEMKFDDEARDKVKTCMDKYLEK